MVCQQAPRRGHRAGGQRRRGPPHQCGRLQSSEGAPWTHPVLVKAEEVQDPQYDPKGRSEVLDLVA